VWLFCQTWTAFHEFTYPHTSISNTGPIWNRENLKTNLIFWKNASLSVQTRNVSIQPLWIFNKYEHKRSVCHHCKTKLVSLRTDNILFISLQVKYMVSWQVYVCVCVHTHTHTHIYIYIYIYIYRFPNCGTPPGGGRCWSSGEGASYLYERHIYFERNTGARKIKYIFW
jgi:hypothetical protein